MTPLAVVFTGASKSQQPSYVSLPAYSGDIRAIASPFSRSELSVPHNARISSQIIIMCVISRQEHIRKFRPLSIR